MALQWPQPAPRLGRLPAYPMAAMRAAVATARAAGADVIDLSMGDPDLPPPPAILAAMAAAAARPGAHRYGVGGGSATLRQAMAAHWAERFRVLLDPDREVLAVDGAQGGIAGLMLALVPEGAGVLAMDPAYAVHLGNPAVAGGEVITIPSRPDQGTLAAFDAACRRAAPRVALALLGWPSAPEGLVAEPGFLAELVGLARKHAVWLVHDAANIDLWLEGPPPASILQVPGAREVAVELYSLTKGWSLAAWRIGFALGNARALEALQRVRSHAAHGPAAAVEAAAIAALESPIGGHPPFRAEYRRRRDALVGGLAAAGWPVAAPAAGFSLWAPLPPALAPMGAAGAAAWLVREAAVVAAPGSIFGPGGEGALRLTLVQPEARLAEAAARIGEALRRA